MDQKHLREPVHNMLLRGGVMIIAVLRAALVGLAISWIPLQHASAEPVLRPNLADHVAGREDVTFADLVRLVVPGTQGNETIDIRGIDSEVVEDLEPLSNAVPRVTAVPVRSGGLDRMALLLDFGSGQAVVGLAILALFDVTGEPRLLDAANVATGNFTSFFYPARIRLGMDDDLLATVSSHFNSGQSYMTTNLILVRNDRLEQVDAIFTFDERLCAYERTQQLDIRQGAGDPVSDVVAVVTELTSATEEKCGDTAIPQPGTRTITVTYHWDPDQRRYIPDSDAFDVLVRANQERF